MKAWAAPIYVSLTQQHIKEFILVRSLIWLCSWIVRLAENQDFKKGKEMEPLSVTWTVASHIIKTYSGLWKPHWFSIWEFVCCRVVSVSETNHKGCLFSWNVSPLKKSNPQVSCCEFWLGGDWCQGGLTFNLFCCVPVGGSRPRQEALRCL